MTIPHFTVPLIYWRPNKSYGQRKVCITGGTFLSGAYLKAERPPNYPMPAIPLRVTFYPPFPASGDEYLHDCILWESNGRIVAFIDNNFDRAHDMEVPWGEYMQVTG